jgi:hypothetical protein
MNFETALEIPHPTDSTGMRNQATLQGRYKLPI